MLAEFIRRMPKVELHVHLEGAVRPETLLRLAQQHGIALPAATVEGLAEWYQFTNFPHFVEIYLLLSKCIRTADDIELVAREFLVGQAAQNIRYTEATYTPYTHYIQKGLTFDEQLAALNRARDWGMQRVGVQVNWIMDIARQVDAAAGRVVAEWAITGMGRGVVALGLGGYEVGNPPEKFADAFALAAAAGLPSVPHAGETAGAASIRGALQVLNAVRIGHGVRCLEDPALVAELRRRQIPLEVCPTSNVCLGVAADMASHPLPLLLAEDLYITINSDDPPLFNTTLTDEYIRIAEAFNFTEDDMERFVLNAARVALLPDREREQLIAAVVQEFQQLRADTLVA
ncbi:MAG: adenosine deaminase [Chloroflexaceae bacterium]|nr:adenosine deaminase [Chloroflexaceae bacterium]NJO05713.1 adenosine deaminase [Chloroflexaceae bacterium]